MTPGNLDITIQRGEDFSLQFTASVGGTLQDFAGATITAQARQTLALDGNLIGNFVGSLVDDNTIKILMTDTVTSAIDSAITKGYYDVLVTTGGGDDRYYLRGKVTVAGSVTVKA